MFGEDYCPLRNSFVNVPESYAWLIWSCTMLLSPFRKRLDLHEVKSKFIISAINLVSPIWTDGCLHEYGMLDSGHSRSSFSLMSIQSLS